MVPIVNKEPLLPVLPGGAGRVRPQFLPSAEGAVGPWGRAGVSHTPQMSQLTAEQTSELPAEGGDTGSED